MRTFRYTHFGFKQGIDECRSKIEFALGITLEERDSSYYGTYFKHDDTLESGVCVILSEPEEVETYPVTSEVSGPTTVMPPLVAKLKAIGAVLLESEELDVDR